MARQLRDPAPLGLSPGAPGGRLPGPLRVEPGKSPTPPAQFGKAARQGGITVNAASKIAGPQWAAMISGNTELPEFITEQLSWANNSLTIAANFKVPKNTIERGWVPDFRAAFLKEDWEISTCHLEITARGTSSSQQITAILVPHLSEGERLGRITPLKDTWTNYDDIVLTFGWTFPKFHARSETGASLKSNRGLVLVAHRIVLTLGTNIQNFNISEGIMVHTLTHEVGVHAGRASQGLSDIHGDKTVESRTQEIDQEFGKSGIKALKSQIYDLIEKFFAKGTKPEAAKR